MKTHRLCIVGAMLALVSFDMAAAQQEGQRQRLAPECRQQIVQLCGTDRSQRRQCMKDNFSKLSDTCQSAIKERMAQRKEARREQKRMMPATPGEQSPSDSPSPQ